MTVRILATGGQAPTRDAYRCRAAGCESWIRSEGRGRPAEFCSTRCREADKLLQRLARHVEAVAAEAQTVEAIDAIRSAVAHALNGVLNVERARVKREAAAARVAAAELVGVPTLAGHAVRAAVETFGGRKSAPPSIA